MLNVLIQDNINMMMDKYNAGGVPTAAEFAFMLGLLGGLSSKYDKLEGELYELRHEIAKRDTEAKKRLADHPSPEAIAPETSVQGGENG